MLLYALFICKKALQKRRMRRNLFDLCVWKTNWQSLSSQKSQRERQTDNVFHLKPHLDVAKKERAAANRAAAVADDETDGYKSLV